MKKSVYFVFLSIFLVNFIPVNTLADKDPTKRALIIAVADYPEDGRWKDISSDNDIPLIEGALLQQGFNAKNIRVINDSLASKEFIVDELKSLSKRAKKGDIVVIHYSGHGQQIQDDNADELDGFDESLIPWDAHLKWSEDYQGENHLRDDEIKVLTDNLRKKLGPDGNVLLILDACHSGTANRGLATSRGTAEVFSEPGFKPLDKNDKGNNDDFIKSPTADLAPMVTLSGAGQHQLNFEYYDKDKETSFGSLSYAFSKALTEADKNTSYRVLFDKIKVSMSTIAPRQSPQVEGDVDMIIFGGEVVETATYYLVKSYWDDKNISINGGNLMGIYDSSEVAFYPMGTVEPEKSDPIVTGTIIYTTAVESDVLLEQAFDEETIKNTWVFITKQNFGDNDLFVRLDIKDNENLETKVVAQLNKMPKVKIVDDNPDIIIEMNNEHTRGANHLQILTTDETELYSKGMTGEDDEDTVDDIVETLNRYLQVNLLKKIEMKDPDIDVSFEIVPVTIDIDHRGFPEIKEYLDIEDFRNEGNELEFSYGQHFLIKVKNNGNSRAYFQIIDIKPDNQLEILLPTSHPRDPRTPAEFVVAIDSEKIMEKDIFFFEPPTGNEYLKLIATREPIDLRMIIKSKGGSSRGPGENTPFEDLLQTSYSKTRAGSYSAPPSAATVYTIPFRVVKIGNE